MKVEIRPEPFTRWCVEGAPLMRAHWEEVANWKDDVPLDVDLPRLAQLEAQGSARAWTARADGELMGYVVCLVGPHLHYRSTLHAWIDVVYVVPALRSTGVGRRLLLKVMGDLKEIGVKRWIAHVKLAHDFGPLLDQFGMVATEVNYEGRL